jgi:glycosyltransferase involved in cell wall biosynthesis
MKLTVLLTVYNNERYLQEAIASVLAQTWRDFELLIGLNGCTDGSERIAREFANDQRVRVLSFADKGRTKTLNQLLGETNAELLAIQDADDVWFPEKLAKQIPLFSSCDVVGTYIDYINEQGKVLIPGPLHCSSDVEIKQAMRRGDNQVANSSSVFSAAAVKQVGGWDGEFSGVEDFDLWIRLAQAGKVFANIPETLVHHRIHRSSSFNAAGNSNYLPRLLKKHGLRQ